MTGSYLPIFNPLLTDVIRPFYEFRTRGLAVLDHYDNASVELLLRMCDIGQARPLGGDYVLNRNFYLVSFEYLMTARVFSYCYKVLQNKEIRHILGGN